VSFEITLYRNIEMLDIGTIDDNGPAGIHTVLLDRDSQDHIAQAEKDAHLVDTINYSGLVAGHNYVLEGKLVDIESGAAVATETISFMAEASDGTLSMEFQFDASNLAGHTLVATQTLKENDEEVVVADNLNDLSETVYFPAIGTKARGLNGQNQITSSTAAGFDHAATQSTLGNIQTAMTSGFGDVQTALCGGFAGVNATVNGAQNALAQQLYTNQISDLERSFAAALPV
jgi:hypothetical protein